MAFTPGQVLTAAQMNALEAATIPTGGVTMYGAGSAPSGWLLCDGTAVSRVTYAALFAVISDTYGVGNGTTTFNLPNLKGRVPVGLDSAQTEFDVLGETSGQKTHTLSSAEMPSHTHTQDAHTHTQNAHNHTSSSHSHSGTTDTGLTNGSWTIPQSAGTSIQANHLVGFAASPTVSRSNNDTFPGSQHDHEFTTGGPSTANTAGPSTANTAGPSTANTVNAGGTAGVTQAHNNLQPYLTLNFIIKT
jgi:microcystin-dependent protein